LEEEEEMNISLVGLGKTGLKSVRAIFGLLQALRHGFGSRAVLRGE
jgi:hypothetical protein